MYQLYTLDLLPDVRTGVITRVHISLCTPCLQWHTAQGAEVVDQVPADDCIVCDAADELASY